MSATLLAALACAWLCPARASAPAAQAQAEQRPAGADLVQALAEQAFLLEARERFRRAWLAADPGARARAGERLRWARRDNASSNAPLPLEWVQLARWTLESEAPWSALQRAADALALRVVPGALDLARAEESRALVARVEAAWRGPFGALAGERGLELELEWRDGAGASAPAAREPFVPALAEDGLALALRAPPREGEWRLAPVLVRAHGEAQQRCGGAPIEVPRFAERDARLAELADQLAQARAQRAQGESEGGPMLRQAEALLAWLRDGLRPASQLSPEALWEQLVRWPAPPSTPQPWPLALGAADAAPAWELAPAAGDVAAVLLVGAPDEPPQALLAGTRGAAWRAVAERAGWTVLALASPLDSARVAELARWLEEQRGIHRLVLVATHASAAQALLTPPAGVDRLVLLMALAGAPEPPESLRVPALLVEAEARDDERALVRGEALGEATSFVWQRRRAPALAVELELPFLVGEWLAAEPVRAARPQGAARPERERSTARPPR